METSKIARTGPGIGDEDRLSSLPEEIIAHILSFLETKHAVGTAILSRRWKDHWSRVSNIDLDCSLVYKSLKQPKGLPYIVRDKRLSERYFKFRRFVDKVLGQHHNFNSLTRFRFHFSVEPSYKNRDSPFETSFERKLVFGPLVEEIDVKVTGKTEFGILQCMRHIPYSFYTLKYLKVVKLFGVVLGAIKGSVFLPSVKILQLCWLEIYDFKPVGRLISGCPVLETLQLENCYPTHRDGDNMVEASLPFLKDLKICDRGDPADPMAHIVLEAPNLEDIYVEQCADFTLKGTGPLSCLHSAYAHFGSEFQVVYDDQIQLVAQISNAKKMRLSQQTMHYLPSCDGVELLVFPRLTHLTIGMAGSSRVVHSLLNSAPKLQTLVIDLEDRWELSLEWASLETARTPDCLLSSLEEIEINECVAYANDWEMIVYLVNAGAVLKNVNMRVKSFDDEARGLEDLESLLRESRGPNRWEARLLLPNNVVIRIDDDRISYNDVESDTEGETDCEEDASYGEAE